MEYFDNIRFHVCRRRFLPREDRLFTADTHSIEFIKNGQFTLQHGPRSYSLNGPILFWMKRAEMYCITEQSPQPKKCEHLYCDCYGEKIERIITCLEEKFPEGFLSPSDPAKMEALFQEQIHLFQRDPAAHHGELAINLDRLMLLCLHSAGDGKNRRMEDPYSIHFLAQEISSNPFQDFNFPKFAAKKGITYYHFRRLFRTAYKVPPTEYLRNQKMMRGAELLRMTDLRIGEIADKCAYDSLMDFSRTFKKYAGISPQEYRKRHGTL